MITRNERRSILLALVALLTGCGEVLFAEIEQTEICKLYPDQVFSGFEHSRRITLNLSEQLPGFDFDAPEGLESEFRITRVELIARSGITDFDFVERVEIALVSPEDSTLGAARVIDYTRAGPTSGTLTMKGSSEVDLYRYLSGGAVTVETALTGQLPPSDWSMDIKTCVYARVRANYVDLADGFVTP